MTAQAIRSSLIGATIGAGLMFILDPARGARRRAVIRDKVRSAAHRTREAARKRQRDAGNRLLGLRSRGRALLAHDVVDDAVIVERVHAALGRVTGHHRAIAVASTGGRVKLTGDVLAREASAIMAATRGVRGVQSVASAWNAHTAADGIPALQGDTATPVRQRLALTSRQWATAAGIGAVAIVATVGRRSYEPAHAS